MKIVIPIAGKGLRLKQDIDHLPKALVPVKGKPMFHWAVAHLPGPYGNYLFICLKDQVENYQLDRKLKEYLSDDIHIMVIDNTTEGQACTVLLAEDFFKDHPLMIHNIDTYFQCDFSFTGRTDIAGAIPYYESYDPAMSFLRLGDGEIVEEVAEKRVISSHATVGLYYFSRGSDFCWAAREMIRKNIRVKDEFYVGPVYNELINAGHKIVGVQADSMWDLGSPGKIQRFESDFNQPIT